MSDAARHRWSVTSRTLAGTVGAYGLTALLVTATSQGLVRLGMDRVEVVTGTTLASYAVFSVIAMAAFHARSAARAWLWLAAFAVLPGVVLSLARLGVFAQ